MFAFIPVRTTFVVFRCVLGFGGYLCIVRSPLVRPSGAGFNSTGLVTDVFLIIPYSLGIYCEGDMKHYLQLPDREEALNMR